MAHRFGVAAFLLASHTVVASTAHADLLIDQSSCNPNIGAVASQRFPRFDDRALEAADDFIVPAGRVYTPGVITSVGDPGSARPAQVEVQIWSDHDGRPSEMLCVETGANESLFSTRMELTLSGDCRTPLTPGRYWLVVMAVSDALGLDQWFWVAVSWTPDSPIGRYYHFRDPEGLSRSPCDDWGEGYWECKAAGIPDLCFTIEGEDTLLDSDGDGVGDDVDNCLELANPSQLTWNVGAYSPGDLVSHNGSLWRCSENSARSTLCGDPQFEPGTNPQGAGAWTEVGACDEQPHPCTTRTWAEGTPYRTGDRVTHGLNEYACRGFPNTERCGQSGYEPGVDPKAQLAWEDVRWCGCESDSDCDDGLFCNGTETCEPTTSSCRAGPPPDCDDGIDCTVDVCSELTRSCEITHDHDFCDNGLFCDGAEACFARFGCFSTGRPSCNDGVSCTQDSCDPELDSCVNVPNDAVCDNGLYCDGTERCDPVLDCVSSGDPCSSTDGSCVELTRTCESCDCWGSLDLPGNPTTLTEVWETLAPASCSDWDTCWNNDSQSIAYCQDNDDHLATLVMTAESGSGPSCQVYFEGQLQSVSIPPEEAEACWLIHQEATHQTNGGGCGLSEL